MSQQGEKFNPSVLPADAMKGFERDDAGTGPKHFLYPGQIFASREPVIITTILGSCIALCLWDWRKRIGGMNHYLLPEGQDDGPNRLRYGNVANPALLHEMTALGCAVKNLRAKIFGGSSSLAAKPALSVGTRNVQLAEEFLHAAGIPIVAKEVSGRRGRRLIFNTHDGATLIREFNPHPAPSALDLKSR